MTRGMRPLAIRAFILCYIAQALVSAVHTFLSPGRLQIRLEHDLGVAHDSGRTALLAVLAIRIGIAAWLAWLVHSRASRFGKWAVIVLFLPRVWQGFSQRAEILEGLATGNPNSMMWLIEFLLYLAAGACLFLPQSEYWFATKGRSVRTEAQTFE